MNKGLHRVQDWSALAEEAKWSSTTLAKICNSTLRTLNRHFHKKMGKAPKSWLSEERQRRGRDWLRDGFSIKETASMLGYKYTTNFARQYKHYWGVSPSLESHDLDSKAMAIVRK